MKKQFCLILIFLTLLSGCALKNGLQDHTGENVSPIPTHYPGQSVESDISQHIPVTYSLENGVLTVSGQGQLNDETEAPWLDQRDQVQEIMIEEGIEGIQTAHFSGLPNLQTVTIAKSVRYTGELFRDCPNLTTVTFLGDTTNLASGMFANCVSLRQIRLPTKIDRLPSDLFTGCTALEEITIPSGIMVIEENAFYGCTSLRKVTLEEGIQSLGDFAFYGCTTLEEMNFPFSLGSLGLSVFGNCPHLTAFAVPEDHPNLDTDKYGLLYTEGFAHLFAAPAQLSGEIILPETITGINEGIFNESEIESIILPESLQYISGRAFQDCTKLTAIIIPGGVDSIGDEAFSGCTALEKVIIHENQNPCHINYGVFRNCTALKEITLPKNIISIGYEAFYCCSALESVYYGGTKEQWENMSIHEWPGNIHQATVYYQ